MKYVLTRSFHIFCCLLFFMIGSSLSQNFSLPITTNSNEARNTFKEGRAYLENVQVAKAANLFDKAIKLDPAFALAHLFRAGTFIGGFNVVKNHNDIAVSLADKVTGGEKNLILYQDALIDGNQSKQKMYLDNLIVSFPYNKRIQQLAGNYYFGIADYENAIRHLRKSVEIDANFAPSYNMLGYAESSLENYDEAESAFKKYIELMPDHPNPYDSYAELLQKRSKYDESIAQYQNAYDKDNSFNAALLGIGHNYVFKGEFEKGREFYDKSYNNSPTINSKLAALFWKATSYIHEGNTKEAMNILAKRKNLAKKDGLTRTLIFANNLEGFILTEMGNVEEGMNKFRLANKMIEDSELPSQIKSNLIVNSRINICYALVANNMLIEADKEAKSCKQIVEKRANINEQQNLHGTLALLELKKKNYQEAIEHFEKTDLSNTPYNLYKLGVVYKEMGNMDMANKYFDKFKKSNQNGIGYAVIAYNSKN